MKPNFTFLAILVLLLGLNYSAFSQTSWEVTGNPIVPGQFLGTLTSSSTQTHIRWNGSGTIQGMNSRLEM